MKHYELSSGFFTDQFAGWHGGRTTAADYEHDLSLLIAALASVGRRRTLAAGHELFAIGNAAPCYYLLLSGELLIRRWCTPSRAGRARDAIRLVIAEELLIFDGDGKHLADCSAITDCVFVRISRRRMKRLATVDPVLRGVLLRVHSIEFQWSLQSFGTNYGGNQHNQPDPSHTEFVADPVLEQRQQSTAP